MPLGVKAGPVIYMRPQRRQRQGPGFLGSLVVLGLVVTALGYGLAWPFLVGGMGQWRWPTAIGYWLVLLFVLSAVGRWHSHRKTYAGTIAGPNGGVVWRCGHKHTVAEEANACAQAELARRKMSRPVASEPSWPRGAWGTADAAEPPSFT